MVSVGVTRRIWVLERCRRRFFFLEERVFGVGTVPQAPFFKYVFGLGSLPQAPFFGRKLCFWCWNVAAGAFFGGKIMFFFVSIMQLLPSIMQLFSDE